MSSQELVAWFVRQFTVFILRTNPFHGNSIADTQGNRTTIITVLMQANKTLKIIMYARATPPCYGQNGWKLAVFTYLVYGILIEKHLPLCQKCKLLVEYLYNDFLIKHTMHDIHINSRLYSTGGGVGRPQISICTVQIRFFGLVLLHQSFHKRGSVVDTLDATSSRVGTSPIWSLVKPYYETT